MARSSHSTKARFFLTTAAFLLLQAGIVQAQGGPGWDHGDGWGGGGDDGGPWACQFGDSDDCDDDNGNDDGTGSYTNGSSALGRYASGSNTSRIITVHAVLASLVWVLLIPVGGILVRSGIKSPWVVRGHAFLQSISYLIYVVAVGMGVYLVRNLPTGRYSLWSDPHTKLGIAILVLAFFQPVLGLIHHNLYKRRVTAVKQGDTTKLPGRTAPGYAHLWLGRVLVVLGMINGGLGLRLASSNPYASDGNGRTKAIAYGVGAGVMFLLYVAFIVLGERRRSKERKEQQHDMSTRGVPLMTHDAEGVQRSGPMPPTYNHPPTYEASQESLRKENETTARYS